MSWARSFYLRKRSSLYKHRRIMSSHLCSEWLFWSFLSKMSKMSNTLIMLTVITSDSSDQSDHFKTLITQWLFNHCCYIILCKRVLTLDSLLRFSFRKSLFLHVFSLHNQKLYLASQRFSWAYEFWACCHVSLWTLQSLAKEMSCWQWNQSLHQVCMSRSQMQSHFLNDEVKKNKDRTRLRSWWAAKCSQADAGNLCKSYSSAKLICVSEE